MKSSYLDRQSIRIPGYDYTTPGYYFITINSLNKKPYFGQLQGGIFHPSSTGNIILDCWVKIPEHFPNASCDAFMLMPDHFHGILELIDMPGHDPSETIRTGTIYHARISVPPLEKNAESFSQPVPASIPTIIRSFKAAVTRIIGKPFWHRGYYEHIVRDADDLKKIRDYIGTQLDRAKYR